MPLSQSEQLVAPAMVPAVPSGHGTQSTWSGTPGWLYSPIEHGSHVSPTRLKPGLHCTENVAVMASDERPSPSMATHSSVAYWPPRDPSSAGVNTIHGDDVRLPVSSGAPSRLEIRPCAGARTSSNVSAASGSLSTSCASR